MWRSSGFFFIGVDVLGISSLCSVGVAETSEEVEITANGDGLECATSVVGRDAPAVAVDVSEAVFLPNNLDGANVDGSMAQRLTGQTPEHLKEAFTTSDLLPFTFKYIEKACVSWIHNM